MGLGKVRRANCGVCFKRLGPDDQAGWLHRRRNEWLASGHDWLRYLRDWAERDRIHPGELLLRLLDERLERQLLTHGPYFFPDLVEWSEIFQREQSPSSSATWRG